MPLNVYINYFLYATAIVGLLVYFVRTPRGRFAWKYYSLYWKFFFVYICGFLLAFLVGSNNPKSYFFSDILRSITFPVSLAFTGLLLQIRKTKRAENITLVFILIFVLGVIFSKLWNINLFGDTIKYSTVQAYNLSFIGFFGFFLLTNRRHKIFARFIILGSWGIAVVSLAKWNFFPVLIFPFLWILLETRQKITKKRVMTSLVISTLIILLLLYYRDNIVQFGLENTYQDWDSYWFSRVVKADISGGRFMIWLDLLRQFSEHPLKGLGFGIRPTYSDVEDHSLYIFLLIRFGIPLFCLVTLSSLKLIGHIFHNEELTGPNRLVLFSLFCYFFLSSAYGACYSQMLNGLTFGGITGIILSRANTHIVTKKK